MLKLVGQCLRACRGGAGWAVSVRAKPCRDRSEQCLRGKACWGGSCLRANACVLEVKLVGGIFISLKRVWSLNSMIVDYTLSRSVVDLSQSLD